MFAILKYKCDINCNMTIVHIGKCLSGIDTYIRLIVQNTNPKEFKHLLCCGYNEVTTPILDKNENKILLYEFNLEREFSPIKDAIAIFGIVNSLRKLKIDIIHAHSSKGGLIGRAVGFFLGKPVIYTPNAFSYLSSESKPKRKFYLFYEKVFRLLTTKFMGCSNSEYQRALNEVGYPAKKAGFWNNSIQQPTSPSRQARRYLIAIGRPSYQKNTLLMVEIMNKVKYTHPNVKLIIVGVGHYSPLKEEVEKKISEYYLNNNIELIAWKSREETLEYLKNAYCYVSTSRYEGLSFANLEAMSLGIPIIASNVDGNRDCTIDNQTGFLVSDNDPEVYASKIQHLLDNPDEREIFSKNSLAFFESDFNIEKRILELETVYQSIKK